MATTPLSSTVLADDGRRALSELSQKLFSIRADAITRPHTEPQPVAMTALLVADHVARNETAAVIAGGALPVGAPEELRRIARALLVVLQDLGGNYLVDSGGTPLELVHQATMQRTTLVNALEHITRRDALVDPWLEAVGRSAGVVDLVYDLRTLAHLARTHAQELALVEPNAYMLALRATTTSDHLERALRDAETEEEANARETIGRLWTIFVPAYDRAVAVAQAAASQHFPSLATIAARRRERPNTSSLGPRARSSHLSPARVSVDSQHSGEVPARVVLPPSPNASASAPPVALLGNVAAKVVAGSTPPSATAAQDDGQLLHVGSDNAAYPGGTRGLASETSSMLPSTLLQTEPPEELASSSIPSNDASTAPAAEPNWAAIRRAERHTVELEVGISSESNFYIGFTENLSESGVFVATYALKPIGAPIEISLSFPDGTALRVPGIVRWLREATQAGWPGMGVQFQALSPDDELAIRKFLALREPMFYDE